MQYALVINDVIESVGGLPSAARRLDTQEWLSPSNGQWTNEEAALCGYLPVTTTPRPPDTATDTHDYSVTLVSGVPTETWTARPKTQAEIDTATAVANEATLSDDLDDALISIQVIIDDTNANINTNPAQRIKDIAKALKKTIRKVNKRFEDTE
jgi:hypothetical protein